MRRRIYIFVNGILCRPGNADHWTDRAVTWIHTNTSYRAEKFEYLAAPLVRFLFQDRRALTLAKMLSFYDSRNWEIVLVGHSNGCDVITKAMQHRLEDKRDEQFDQVHFYAPAIIPSAGIPALKDMLERQSIYKLVINVGGCDRVLKTLQGLGGLLRKLGARYGAIGGMNPDKLAFIFGGYKAKVQVHPCKGHTTFFDRGLPFETTMREVLKG